MELAYKKENIFLHKFMPCLLFFMIAVMCLFGSYSNATDVNFSYNDSSYTTIFDDNVLSDYPYYFICTQGGYVYLLYSNTPCIFSIYNDGSFYAYVPSNPSTNQLRIASRYFDLSSTTTLDFSNTSADIVNGFNVSMLPSAVVSSNYDIYDTSDNLVFQAPPQQVEAQGIIAEKTQGVEMDKTLAEIVGILPVILLTIVGILAVRKGILFLIARMKRA